MSGLEGVEMRTISNDDGGEIVCLDIKDREKWNSKLGKLLPYFGRMIFEEYERTPYSQEAGDKGLNQIKISLYILGKENRIMGFASTENLSTASESGPVVVTRDIMVKKEERGKGYGNKLASMFFDENPYASLGYSKTPQAVSARRKMAEKYGYTFFWGGMNVDRGKEEEVDFLRKMLKKFLKKEGILSQREAPEGFVFLSSTPEGATVLPPLSPDEISFDENDPIKCTR